MKIELKNIRYVQNKQLILDNINLIIEDKEYCAFVGPTGAGKTSLIGIISGLYRPSAGQVLFNGKDVTNLPPNERHCGVMFESYALFPHLNILENVSYPRHMLEANQEETHSIARELLQLVRIPNRDHALPKECSGGMQQRVALARALMALESSGLLILDEPFKALDAGLRLNLRKEVRDIVKSPQLALTTIHITNDMQEAMMADKIVVLNKGHITQVGTPISIMYSPVDLFVANFFSTELNYFHGKVLKVELVEGMGMKNLPLTKVIIQSEEGYFLYAKTEKHFQVGDAVTFLIRSQYFKARHKRREDKSNNIVGVVKRAKFMGAWLRLEIEAPFRPEYLLPDGCVSERGPLNAPSPTSTTLPITPPATPSASSPATPPVTPPATPHGPCQIKLLKVEVPTTKVAVHNFHVGETVTVYYSSEYVIVFPRIPPEALERELRVN